MLPKLPIKAVHAQSITHPHKFRCGTLGGAWLVRAAVLAPRTPGSPRAMRTEQFIDNVVVHHCPSGVHCFGGFLTSAPVAIPDLFSGG
jgi:hypothetical protein